MSTRRSVSAFLGSGRSTGRLAAWDQKDNVPRSRWGGPSLTINPLKTASMSRRSARSGYEVLIRATKSASRWAKPAKIGRPRLVTPLVLTPLVIGAVRIAVTSTPEPTGPQAILAQTPGEPEVKGSIMRGSGAPLMTELQPTGEPTPGSCLRARRRSGSRWWCLALAASTAPVSRYALAHSRG